MFSQVVCVDLEEHLGKIRYANGLHPEVPLIAHFQLDLEQAMKLLPELQSFFPGQLLEHETDAVRECSQRDVFLVFDGESIENLLLYLWESLGDVLSRFMDNLRILWDKLPFW